MNHFDEQQSWSDQDVDRLLTQFFAAEMPPAIRQLPTHADVSASASVQSQPVAVASPAPEATRYSAWAGLATAAAALLMAVVFAPVFRTADKPIVKVVQSVPDPVLLEKDQTTVEVFDLEDGAVEQRTNLRWKNVSTNDPGSGASVEWIMPELEIEFFDVDEADESPSVRG